MRQRRRTTQAARLLPASARYGRPERRRPGSARLSHGFLRLVPARSISSVISSPARFPAITRTFRDSLLSAGDAPAEPALPRPGGPESAPGALALKPVLVPILVRRGSPAGRFRSRSSSPAGELPSSDEERSGKEAPGQDGARPRSSGSGRWRSGGTGAWATPAKRRRPGDDEAGRVLNSVLDLGVNLIDTAAAYHRSEERIGAHLSGQADPSTSSRPSAASTTASPARSTTSATGRSGDPSTRAWSGSGPTSSTSCRSTSARTLGRSWTTARRSRR